MCSLSNRSRRAFRTSAQKTGNPAVPEPLPGHGLPALPGARPAAPACATIVSACYLAPRCAARDARLPLPEDRWCARVPSQTACLRRRGDCLRLPIPRRSPGAPVQVLRGPGDRGLPGRGVGASRWRRRPEARPHRRFPGFRGAASRAWPEPGACAGPACGANGWGSRSMRVRSPRSATRLPSRGSTGPDGAAIFAGHSPSGGRWMGCTSLSSTT